MNKKFNCILLVGAGGMALEYAKVLFAMNEKFVIVGRGEKSARSFTQLLGQNVITGGINRWIQKRNFTPDKAIVAVSGDQLGMVAINLLKIGVKSILLEKPGGYNFAEIRKVANESKKRSSQIYIAYNRRFYASTIAARKIIKKDGGVSSCFFEFTELGYLVLKLKNLDQIKKEWFLHNSTHVIDLAFFLSGKPEEMSTYVSGELSWSNNPSTYVGAGITDKGCLFSYHSNWNAPGRWNLEILTKKHRLIFKPMEKLHIQKIGSLEIKELVLDNGLDITFKPGLYEEVKSFLENNTADLCSIEEQDVKLSFYKDILKMKK